MRVLRYFWGSAGLAGALLSIVCLAAYAIDPAQLADPALQARYTALTHEMRCVQCVNSTLADSDVEVAGEVRRQIRTMLLSGKSDEQIRDYMVSRYSEFILFKPRYSARNAWLWLAPLVLLVTGILVAGRIVGQRRRLLEADDAPLDDS